MPRIGAPPSYSQDTGWIAPTLLNSWVHLGSPWSTVKYRKINGIVYIKGIVQTGSAGTDVFVLPAGFRPAEDRAQHTLVGGSAVYVKANGSVNVNVKVGSYISLDDLEPFPADN